MPGWCLGSLTQPNTTLDQLLTESSLLVLEGVGASLVGPLDAAGPEGGTK